MFYEKKIKYLDYLVSGEKKRGAGFVKTEVRDRDLRMKIRINGIYTAKPLETDIVVKGAGKTAVLRRIRLNNGSGDSGEIRMNAEHMGGNLSYGELEQIVIPLSEKCEIVCIWKTASEREGENALRPNTNIARAGERIQQRKEEERGKEKESRREKESREVPESREELEEREVRREEPGQGNRKNPVKEEREHDRESAFGEEEYESAGREADKEEQIVREAEEKVRAAGAAPYETIGENAEGKDFFESSKEEAGDNPAGETARCDRDFPGEEVTVQNQHGSRRIEGYDRNEKMPREDKWRQLAAIYPHMDMAAEISDCITIKPADFVIFPMKYYSLVTNSFLLHGYHNYGHLALARVEKRGEIRYYIGVPGIFFDKERQVALMFGFESFECGKDFSEAGDFGYYMIRVEL